MRAEYCETWTLFLNLYWPLEQRLVRINSRALRALHFFLLVKREAYGPMIFSWTVFKMQGLARISFILIAWKCKNKNFF